MLMMLMLGLALAKDSAPAEAPPELPEIEQYLDDEDAFVSALRAQDNRYDKRARLLLRRAAVREEAGDAAGTEALLEEAEDLIETIHQAYRFGLCHFPNNARLHNYHGELISDWLGGGREAVLAWRRALAEDPDLPSAQANLGMHYCSTGNVKMGLPLLEDAIKAEKDNADFYYNLSNVYVLEADRVQEVRGWSPKKLYKQLMRASIKAVDRAPHDFAIRQNYAVNFFAATEFEVDIDWGNAAAAWQEARPYADNLDDLYYTWLNEGRAWIWAEGRAQAQRCIREALRIRPEAEDAQVVLRELESGAEF
ncbi:MAG: hypothetical protein ACLFTT_02125 [Candidatus Hydrogenedentota bacterium]